MLSKITFPRKSARRSGDSVLTQVLLLNSGARPRSGRAASFGRFDTMVLEAQLDNNAIIIKKRIIFICNMYLQSYKYIVLIGDYKMITYSEIIH